MEQYSWKLSAIGYDMVECRKDKERDSCLELFNATIDSLVALPGSFSHAFDSVANVKVLNSPNGKFRLLTWGFRHPNDSFSFFGILQYADPERPYVWLSDSAHAIGNSTATVNGEFSPERWYGAIYYGIQEVRNKKESYYVLLGWNGKTAKTDLKVIEALSWDDEGEAVFGKPVFSAGPDEALEYRVIFEYRNAANMTLRFDDKKGNIIFENIIPNDPKARGVYELYLPDGTYDKYRLKKGVWERYSEY